MYFGVNFTIHFKRSSTKIIGDLVEFELVQCSLIKTLTMIINEKLLLNYCIKLQTKRSKSTEQ